MFGHQYYHSILRKYIINFGNLFNDIVVQRFDSAGNRVQTIDVPLAYGPKERFLVRITQDPDIDRGVAISLPRIGFELVGMTYDPQRKLSSTKRNLEITLTDGDTLRSQFVPVPYNINLQLFIMVTNADDGVQIMEQILPFFTPDWTSQIKLIPELGITMDIPTVLQSVSIEDTYEGDFETRRALIWTLDFMVRGYIYGPIKTTGVIKRSIANLYAVKGTGKVTAADIARSKVSDRITVTPGLLANGSPTTNSALSIPISQISSNDDFGFAIDIEHFDDGIG